MPKVKRLRGDSEGFHAGILRHYSGVWYLYLNAINKKLAATSQLDYNPSDLLGSPGVGKNGQGADWSRTGAAIPRTRAQEIVDELLPNRTFSNSLYRGLVTEGILIEDKSVVDRQPYQKMSALHCL